MQKSLKKLKGVVLITQSLAMGGAEKGLMPVLFWFHKQKIPVKAWTTSSQFNSELNSRGVKAYKIPIVVDVIGDWKGLIKGLVLFPFAFIYYGYVTYKNRNFGTILLSDFPEKIFVTPWAKLMNIPVVWIEHGPIQDVFSKFNGLPKFLYHLVSNLPDFVLVPSQHTRKCNLGITGLPSAKIEVVPSCVEPPKLITSTSQKLTAYCVSRMEKGKGQDLLIAAWPAVLKKFPNARLFFTGEGDFKKQLEKQVYNLNLTSSVSFLGWVKDLNKTIFPFSVSVFPSVWPLEGFGLVLVETMALGKPIICFKTGPYPEVVNSDCAIMVAKGNIKGLSDAIICLFSHPELAKRLGLKGRERYKKVFTPDKIAPRYGELLLRAQIACQK
jgi:glycosyltransferase involved in cell wall biosynthesis